MIPIPSQKTRLRRHASVIATVILLSACTPVGLDALQQDLTRVAQERVMKALAHYYSGELGKGITSVVASLAQPGGYLDNPVARILLPPPLGMVLGVVQDLNADPQATLLSVLINQAAEQAIPGAGPILQAALTQLTPTEVLQLLDGGKTAGSAALKEKASAMLETALAPLISDQLAASGALLVYKEMLESLPLPAEAVEVMGPPVESAVAEVAAEPMAEPVRDLRQYVTEQTVEGLFNLLGAEEAAIRDNLTNLGSGLMPGI